MVVEIVCNTYCLKTGIFKKGPFQNISQYQISNRNLNARMKRVPRHLSTRLLSMVAGLAGRQFEKLTAMAVQAFLADIYSNRSFFMILYTTNRSLSTILYTKAMAVWPATAGHEQPGSHLLEYKYKPENIFSSDFRILIYSLRIFIFFF
jgi:hypothetical protein